MSRVQKPRQGRNRRNAPAPWPANTQPPAPLRLFAILSMEGTATTAVAQYGSGTAPGDLPDELAEFADSPAIEGMVETIADLFAITSVALHPTDKTKIIFTHENAGVNPVIAIHITAGWARFRNVRNAPLPTNAIP